MWVFTTTVPNSDPPQNRDWRYFSQDEAQAAFDSVQTNVPENNPHNLREESDDYIPIEDREAIPYLFPKGVNRYSQLPVR
jgi:hypothetical protein